MARLSDCLTSKQHLAPFLTLTLRGNELFVNHSSREVPEAGTSEA